MDALREKGQGSVPPVLRGALLVLLMTCLGLPFFQPGSARGGETFYSIQVGAYRDKESAVKNVEALKHMGHKAFYRQESVKGKGQWYRVYIERYESRERAEKEAGILKDLGLISKYSVRVLGGAPGAASPPAGKGDSVCFLHVSSFKDKSHAENRVAALKELGHKAFFVEEKVGGEDWFRVYIGEFENEKVAREVGSSLREKGVISYFKPVIIDRKVLNK